jgi:hypothetical protein
MHERIQNLLWLLGSSRIIQINEGPALYLPVQYGKFLPDDIDI